METWLDKNPDHKWESWFDAETSGVWRLPDFPFWLTDRLGNRFEVYAFNRYCCFEGLLNGKWHIVSKEFTYVNSLSKTK